MRIGIRFRCFLLSFDIKNDLHVVTSFEYFFFRVRKDNSTCYICVSIEPNTFFYVQYDSVICIKIFNDTLDNNDRSSINFCRSK